MKRAFKISQLIDIVTLFQGFLDEFQQKRIEFIAQNVEKLTSLKAKSKVSGNRSKVLGIIPARGGSKSVPHKNLAMVAGKPLIAYTLESARYAKCLDRLIVSTDNRQIAAVSKSYSVDVPFIRPAVLARDNTPMLEVILHAVRWLNLHENYHPDYVVLLQPTSPLRSNKDIEAVVALAKKMDADSVVSVCPIDQHPCWAKTITKEGRLVDFLRQKKSYALRQGLPPAYALNGAIYLIKWKTLLKRKTFYTHKTYAYVMPPERSLDIDTPWQLHLTKLILGGKCRASH